MVSDLSTNVDLGKYCNSFSDKTNSNKDEKQSRNLRNLGEVHFDDLLGIEAWTSLMYCQGTSFQAQQYIE